MSANPWPTWWPTDREQEQQPKGGELWAQLKAAGDLSQARPTRADGVLSKEMEDASGPHTILKNPRTHTYARLSPEEYWVWQQLDGSRTVQQLVLAYFLKYKAFALAAILGLTHRLREQLMLSERPRLLYAQIARTLQERRPLYRLTWLARVVFTKEWDVKGLDGYLDRIYKYGGWVLFSLPVQIILLLVSVAGTALFVALANDPQYQILSGGFEVAVLRLGILAYIPFVIHEFGHAITAKHVGCEVYRGGVMLYFGLPAAFVDTTDVWMYGKRARLAVTWAGPYTGYIIAGACALGVYFGIGLPSAITSLLLQIALVSIVTSTYNLLPVLKLDGYYLLADALEIPALRERSVAFVRGPLRAKLLKREAWTREEWIFLFFGLLAIVSTVYFIYLGIAFWDSQASQSISQLLHRNGETATQLFNLFIVLLALSLGAYLAYALASQSGRLIDWLRQKGLLATRGRAAMVMAAGAVILTGLPALVLPTLANWLVIVGAGLIYALAAWLALGTFCDMRGSVHASMWLMAATGLALGCSAMMVMGIDNQGWPSEVLSAAGLVCALLALTSGGRLVIGLRGSWRAGSMSLYGMGLAVWGMALGMRAYIPLAQVQLLAGLLLAAALVHWRMRPATSRAEIAPLEGQTISTTRAKIVQIFNYLRTTSLGEVEADFGRKTRERVASGGYRQSGLWGWQKKRKLSPGMEISSTQTGMTPNDYGGAMAILLEELLGDIEKAGGRNYACRALAFGFDGLGWELGELAEDYLLKYIPQAASLSGHLAKVHGLQAEVQELLRSAQLFTTMAEDDIKALSEQFKAVRFEPGDEIIRQDEAGEAFYLIRLGKVEVVRRDAVGEHSLNQLARGDYFGEGALLSGERRNATVRALLPSEVLALRRDDFNRLVRKNFELLGKMQETMRRLNLLRQIPLFAGFEGFELNLLANRLEQEEVPAGQAIFRQGEAGDRFYIIASGQVSIQIRDDTDEPAVERATLGTGEYFGEIALILDTMRTASVIATQATILLSLSAEDFREMVAESRGVKQALERASSRRVLANDRWMRQGPVAGTPEGILQQ